MNPLWTARAIAAATNGTASADFTVHGVAFDSREVGKGDLFIAMKGEATDGHKFIDKAIAAGASGIVCETAIDHPHVRVADSAIALNALGFASRVRCHGRIIGVTGSAGKTGTKEALFAALDRFRPGKAHRSVKSYNNHVGVPLSLARMPSTADYGVFEMGMNHAGELAALTRMVRPHVAIVTTIAPAHMEFFGSEEAIADAKGEIFEGLEPGGTAIVPFDSPHYDRLRAKAEKHAAHVVSFGLGAGADVRAVDWLSDGRGGSLVTAQVQDALLCFTIAQAGAHWVSNAMAVLAAVKAVGGDLPAAGLAFAEMAGLAGRGARHQLALPGGHILLIDESYNANPASMAATIGQLGTESGTRKVAILGAMKELGPGGEAYHAGLAAPLVAAGVHFALLVGAEMAPLAKALEGRIDFAHVPDHQTAKARLKDLIRAGDAVLVKGSNSVGLSHLVTALTNGDY
ncbi:MULTISPECIES: UDP-N-acetylmuramoyl-tripeptide--D-alanyl-D-alanine ligase [unclassified Sphingopyxis]|uniref:UDP-N-acetylmuramoyl-tripeptide--D-alanyl-D- alanine ligase n=1 Tax=unclassified Sphingopyxis TaxID=2614943 RepID=UPI000736A7DC|nr:MULTISPECIES: UDP-N-acetylmuramoyl-tripeptide--D-alanyl-D-alanine ligase [unclassified Sphingopyxis]KTE29119.1 UDP-N-acetylmuramoylalanyl-D-glutamyl-2, 6-diaminopimelate--D-alanyl-D-alanine ligase [Sphingopyxis sp. HIX]KTE78030.1 UDP-N-acetylmuramoylalanyl-D-glutamyl-2, 6-diaminopimelate--D-alanyl-D-alanine ligase [Sphingopyxis sp. HXXIV]